MSDNFELTDLNVWPFLVLFWVKSSKDPETAKYCLRLAEINRWHMMDLHMQGGEECRVV